MPKTKATTKTTALTTTTKHGEEPEIASKFGLAIAFLLSFLPFYVQFVIRLLLTHFPPRYRPSTGTCTLVGAGPGDPSLLTIGAHEAIRNADIVISDLLVPERIQALVRGKLLKLPRTTRRKSDDAQCDAYVWMRDYIRLGLRVVRLKGGDPFVFGRGGEEVLYLRSEGIPAARIKVIPGISSCIAAGESALIPVTHRGVADQFLVVTGRGEGGRVPDIPSFSARRTVVVMMGMSRLHMLVTSFLNDAHYPRHTPCAIVEKATWADQRVVRGTLETIEKLVEMQGIKNPAVVYVGHVVNILANGGNKCMVNTPDEGVEV
ncbi:hypothetical protein PhCBS80983_g02371 [Powellomyces hirtus]|uniref:Tetrapyrrole methylase domain-containing protein n=1 Tax=Powellomyces hirtus TaxID=109895 RepID=A0A507E6B8_9FUNG|nr:hypothetical protein PhCBS80983_g02371 [Powellomyces hirtus]